MEIESLRRALAEEDVTKLAEWDRSLPTGEHLNDRWTRAQRLGFGVRASIYDSSVVMGDVRIDHDVWIGPWVLLDGTGGGLTIGAWCSISAGVQIYTHDTVFFALSGGKVDRVVGPVVIGERTYVGPQSVLTANLSIGSMCVVAANSVVKHDVPDRTVVGGSPARVLGTVEGDGADLRLVYESRTVRKRP